MEGNRILVFLFVKNYFRAVLLRTREFGFEIQWESFIEALFGEFE